MSTSGELPVPDWSRDTFIGFLSGDTELDHRNVRMLLETVSLGNSTVPHEEFLRSVVEKTLAITGADRCLLFLLEGDRLVVSGALDSNLEEIELQEDYSRSFPEQVMVTGEAVCVGRSEMGEDSASESMVDHGLSTVMCAPMRARDEIIGVLYVDSHTLLTDFSRSDLRLFKALSCLLASAIEHSQLLRAKQDLVVAGEIQRRLLPSEGFEVPGVEAYGESRPCDETGGDYFDYFSLEGGHVGLAIGDVSGHGVGAAMLMATARAVLRAHVAVESDPGKVIEYVNLALARDTVGGRFLTVFYADLDPETGRLVYVRAGHEVPLLYRGRTDEVVELGGAGFMVGVDPAATYETVGPLETESGDIVVLYTDGITEAPRIGTKRGALDLFGEGRLVDVIREYHRSSARRIVQKVFSAVEEFAGSGGDQDDRTLVVAKITDARESLRLD